MEPYSQTEAEAIAKQLLSARGESHERTEYIGHGSTNSVFSVVTPLKHYILRIATPRAGKYASYESDFAIRRALWNAGQPVAKPIATDQSSVMPGDVCWALDEWVEGAHPVRGKITSSVSYELGRLLKKLHKLSATGFGKLENFRDQLHGRYESPEDGMLSRLEAPWPFSQTSLKEHPAIRKNPSLQEKLTPMEPDLLAFVRENKQSAVVHSDLHEGQLLVKYKKLTAVLDFNDAVIGRPEWDFGSYLYFHGDACLSDLLDGYTSDSIEKKSFANQANLAGILIALHHGNRGIVLNRPHRIEASERFLSCRL